MLVEYGTSTCICQKYSYSLQTDRGAMDWIDMNQSKGDTCGPFY